MAGVTKPQSPSLLRAAALQMGLHLRRCARLRIVLPALGLAVLCAVAAAGLGHASPGDLNVVPTFFETFVTRAIALMALAMGASAVRADADHGALAAFLLRPRAAVALPLGRLVATAALVGVFALGTTAAVFGSAAAFGVTVDAARLPFVGLAAVLAAASYTAVFVFLGAVSRHATALGLSWLVVVDMGLGNLSDRIGLLAPHNSLVLVAGFDPDLALSGSAGLGFWFALAQIAILSLGAAIGLVWRFRGDLPE